MLRGNVGEWSEPYVFLRLLGSGRIYAADSNLNRIENMYFPILKVIGDAINNGHFEYKLLGRSETVAIYFNDKEIKRLPASQFQKEADTVYSEIYRAKLNKLRTFEIPEAENFLNSIGHTKLKASNEQKADINLQIHDISTGYEPIVGFSIKSELGSAPTLINASKITNFVYEVKGLTDSQINEINSICTKYKIKERMSKIKACATSIRFDHMHDKTFESNLMMIDSNMPEILAHALAIHYDTNVKDCSSVISMVERANPLRYPRPGLYQYKFKKFLCAIALGLVPSKPWNGTEEANGGYIIVTKTGDVLAYHIYNREFFESYLLKNTIFERASTSKHNYATLYKVDGKTYLNLNLQIRFRT